MRARYYSIEHMRFMSADTLTGFITNPVTLNRYAFANGNPIRFVDPFGRSATLIAGAHTSLDAAGLIPGWGMIFDGVNLIWYAAEGDWVNAGLSAVSFVPLAGDAAGGVRLGAKVVRGVDAATGAVAGGRAARASVASDVVSTGRTTPNSLMEQIVFREVMENPLIDAKRIDSLTLSDPRWPAGDGWVKMERTVRSANGELATVHFNYNVRTGIIADMKLKP